MVMPRARCVHAERAIDARRPGFPQPLSLIREPCLAGRALASWPGALGLPQSWGISCAQMAIIPTKSVIDASAAASSTNIFNMPTS